MAETKEYLILMPVDGEHHSLEAFHWYLDHFYHKGHEIGLVNIYTAPDKPGYIMQHAAKHDLHTLANEEYQRNFDEALRRSSGIIFQYQQLCSKRGVKSRAFSMEKTDSVGHLICKIATENNADCIVLGQRALGAIKRVFGSVSDHVLHHARIPVLTVPVSKDKVSLDTSK